MRQRLWHVFGPWAVSGRQVRTLARHLFCSAIRLQSEPMTPPRSFRGDDAVRSAVCGAASSTRKRARIRSRGLFVVLVDPWRAPLLETGDRTEVKTRPVQKRFSSQPSPTPSIEVFRDCGPETLGPYRRPRTRSRSRYAPVLRASPQCSTLSASGALVKAGTSPTAKTFVAW